MMLKRLWLALALGAALLASVEGATRLAGAVDIPLYRADPVLGYIPQPNQSGAFLNKNHWRFNELSMGAPAFSGGGTLLVGDSIVLGGNPVDEPAKLGSQLAKQTGRPVWPISAGSWALVNELRWLRQHPDVVGRVDRVAFVLNSDDFTTPSVWRSEYTHPTRRPICAICYIAAKQAAQRIAGPEAAKAEGEWRPEMASFLASAGRPVTVFLYPKRGEDGSILRRRSDQLASVGARVVILAEHPEWRPAYRDSIHPTDATTAQIAELIARDLQGPRVYPARLARQGDKPRL